MIQLGRKTPIISLHSAFQNTQKTLILIWKSSWAVFIGQVHSEILCDRIWGRIDRIRIWQNLRQNWQNQVWIKVAQRTKLYMLRSCNQTSLLEWEMCNNCSLSCGHSDTHSWTHSVTHTVENTQAAQVWVKTAQLHFKENLAISNSSQKALKSLLW